MMGGSHVDDDWEFPLSNGVSNIVLVGRTGNGKSATGNSILGRRAFKSGRRSSGVTTTTELQNTVLRDGRVLNVIDTPGLFDSSVGSDSIGKEIVKCFKFTSDGIHAVVAVFSVRSRFSVEEYAAIKSLLNIFGEKISNYMIVVFTGGDELEENDETLEDYLGRDCPELLKEILSLCKNRVVLFDNKTKDEKVRVKQVIELLSLVDKISIENGGQPYSDEFFLSLREGAMKLDVITREAESSKGYSKEQFLVMKKQMTISYERQLKEIYEMIETRLRETTERLEKQLAVEQAARLKAEKLAHSAQKKSDDEIREVRKSLEKAKLESEELRKQAQSLKCHIL